jgi:glycosyltransferase involved in cell wall biosynthesis
LTNTLWTILTGEYPPQPGGVSDYTQQVAAALAAAGDDVHVWAPPVPGESDPAGAVQLHRLPDHFGQRSFPLLEAHLRQRRGGRVLVQYVPHAFGSRAMNIRFCRWVRKIARTGVPVDIMFHEVAYPLEKGQPLKHKVLALVNRQMARWLCADADRVFISISAWEPYLREMGVSNPTQWIPVPSNIVQQAQPDAVLALRARYGAPVLIGHFGTYGTLVAKELREVLVSLVEGHPSRKLLLLGRGGETFASALTSDFPAMAGRVHAPGGLDSLPLANHLSACDLLVQPYSDGISCRRSSAMAALALGVPVVSCLGDSSERLWAQSAAIALAPNLDALEIAAVAQRLIYDTAAAAELGRLGQALYRSRFDLRYTTEALRAPLPATSRRLP